MREFRPKHPPGFTPFWKHFPQKDWDEVDWQNWEREGRPRVPRDKALPDRRPTTRKLPVPPASQILPAGFSLRPETRSQKADRVLKQYGIR